MGADYKRTNEAATNWHKVAGGVAWTDIGDSGTVPPHPAGIGDPEYTGGVCFRLMNSGSWL